MYCYIAVHVDRPGVKQLKSTLMNDTTDRQQQTIKLIDRIIELAPDKSTVSSALKIRRRLKLLPMTVVMANFMPEASIAEKIRALEIARTTYYGWIQGRFRPNHKLAKKLAKFTGMDADEIRGRNR
jgi:DNA-binding XRE family transcriptional regulator